MTMRITTDAELEEILSRPSDADAEAIAKLDGDLLILGVGGKMGPSLARRARRAAEKAGIQKKILAVARFSDANLRDALESDGIATLITDLLEPGALAKLPDLPNVIFMAARKFGTTGSEDLTWAMNTFLPGLVAERYRSSRIVAFSTGNVYPLRNGTQGGATESTSVAPESEYAQSVLGRERMFEYGSRQWNTPVTILRLNYAIDLRYGVLHDIAAAVFEGRPVSLRMPLVNVIWQGDANSACLRSFAHCQSPPAILNIAGRETLSVRYLAEEFARRFKVQPLFTGDESSSALLSNGAKAHQLFGYPSVTVPEMIEWTAAWISAGGSRLNKPTHFEVRDGKF
jgi:nucleoside-diphosphate-sugar epimerase